MEGGNLPVRKVCTRCNLEKPRDEYYRSQYSRTGLYSHCKTCHRALLRTKRKRVAEEKAMARQPLHAATPSTGPLGLATHLPPRQISRTRVIAYFARAANRVGVSTAIMAWGWQRPFVLVRYLQRLSGLLCMVMAILVSRQTDPKHTANVVTLTAGHVLQVAPWRSLPDTPPPALVAFSRNQQQRVVPYRATTPRSPNARPHPVRPVIRVTMPNSAGPTQDALMQLMLQQQQLQQQAPVPMLNVGMPSVTDPQSVVMHLLKTMAAPNAAPPSSPPSQGVASVLAALLQPQQPSPQQQISAILRTMQAASAPQPSADDVILQQLLRVMQEQPQQQAPSLSLETLLRMLQGQP